MPVSTLSTCGSTSPSSELLELPANPHHLEGLLYPILLGCWSHIELTVEHLRLYVRDILLLRVVILKAATH